MLRISVATFAASILASSVQAQSGAYTLTDSSTTLVYTITQDTGGDVPLASKVFNYPDLPEHADSGTGPRGTQQGYNICNSTTLDKNSLCQTGFINSIDDFCLWGGFDPSGNLTTVADEEEELVAYCTTATHGSRVITPGALTGVQFIKTPDYVEVVGYIDQTALNLQSNDSGGEEDPHGADERGNPLGSLMYSSAFGNGTNSPYVQIHEWSYFVGGGVFCFKVCDPAGSRAAELCQHTYDRIGCTFNDPANYNSINGTFTSCLGDDQNPVGVYVSNGVTQTYTQPPESDGVINLSSVYSTSIPPTSSCSTFTSSNLFTALASYHSSDSSSAPTSAATSSGAYGASAKADKAEAKATSAATTSLATTSSSTGVAGKHGLDIAIMLTGLLGAMVALA